MYRFETSKDIKKAARAIAEGIILIALFAAAVRALTVSTHYQPYNKNDKAVVSGEDHGFITVSYFGVDRQETNTLISTKQLDEQLKALHELGYVTVSQQDVMDYYNNGTPLPDKAMLLMFEDGRRDTALFADKILEKYNFSASVLSYADKFAEKDPKFLSAKDMLGLTENGYWELGTNGYRLSYINCYDRYDRFLGQMTSDEFVRVNQYLGRDYNHYLMDFIRDEDRVPTESANAMKSRIAQDYVYMQEIYGSELGFVPELYCIMHSNTGRYGNNQKVSEANAGALESVFGMNYNRDGFSYNDRASSIYDLTRIQPQSYWSTNHLLMRIWDDLPDEEKDNIIFVNGDEKYAADGMAQWDMESGAAAYKKDNIILTSLPQAEGVLTLKDKTAEDTDVSVDLKGNKIGIQTIYLRSDAERNQYVAVSLENNQLVISEKGGAADGERFRMDLHELTPLKDRISVEEDKRASLKAEYNMRGRFAKSSADSLVFYAAAGKAGREPARSVAEGAEEYIPDIEINELGDTKLDISLKGNTIHVSVNGSDVTGDGVEVSVTGSGRVALGANWGGWGYSQRNVSDDVYDGIFKDLIIRNGDSVLFDNSLHGAAWLLDMAANIGNAVLNWFITHL